MGTKKLVAMATIARLLIPTSLPSIDFVKNNPEEEAPNAIAKFVMALSRLLNEPR